MTRTNARPFIGATEFFAIVLFLALGFSLVAVPTAYGSIASGEAPAPIVQQSTALDEATAACRMITAQTGVSECHVMDWNPSLDVIVPDSRADTAKVFCEEAAAAIAERFKLLSGKTWKVRAFSSGLVPPTAACRVR